MGKLERNYGWKRIVKEAEKVNAIVKTASGHTDNNKMEEKKKEINVLWLNEEEEWNNSNFQFSKWTAFQCWTTRDCFAVVETNEKDVVTANGRCHWPLISPLRMLFKYWTKIFYRPCSTRTVNFVQMGIESFNHSRIRLDWWSWWHLNNDELVISLTGRWITMATSVKLPFFMTLLLFVSSANGNLHYDN